MPSCLHEALLRLFRNRPELAPELLREAVHVPVPPYTEVRIGSADLNEVQPAEYRADMVVLLLDGVPVLGIIVEVQLSRDKDKPYVWPAYVAVLRARLRCPVYLLVVAVEEEIARWAGRELEIGGGNRFVPLVLGPSDVPKVKDPERAKEVPELAVLSAMAHGKDADIHEAAKIGEAAAVAASELDWDRAAFYYDLVFASLSQAAKAALEAMMQEEGYEFQSEFARHYFGMGREEGLEKGLEKGREEGLRAGLEEGRVGILLKQLEKKFGAVPPSVEARVREASVAELDLFAERILTAESIDGVLAGE